PLAPGGSRARSGAGIARRWCAPPPPPGRSARGHPPRSGAWESRRRASATVYVRRARLSGGVCDPDHAGRLTGGGPVLLMRAGRGRFLAAILMCWWDAVRMAWFYWFGLVRFLLVFVGWIWGLLRLGVSLMWRTLKNLVTSPFALLDSTSRQPGVPWIAFVLLVFWSAIEATIFTFTLRPTMAELLADLTGFQVNP